MLRSEPSENSFERNVVDSVEVGIHRHEVDCRRRSGSHDRRRKITTSVSLSTSKRMRRKNVLEAALGNVVMQVDEIVLTCAGTPATTSASARAFGRSGMAP